MCFLSQIAKNYSSKCKKTACIINGAIPPYFQQRLVECMRNEPFFKVHVMHGHGPMSGICTKVIKFCYEPCPPRPISLLRHCLPWQLCWSGLISMTSAHTQTDTQTDRQTDRQIDRQTDTQTDRQTDTQTDRQTDRQTDTRRQTDRQTHTHAHRYTGTHTHTHRGEQLTWWLAATCAVSKCHVAMRACCNLLGSRFMFTHEEITSS